MRTNKANVKPALKLKDFKAAIWSNAEVVGIVGFCIILTQDEQQLPKSLEKKYRRYVLFTTNKHLVDEISWEMLQKGYDGNVIRWATERQRRWYERTQEDIKLLNIRLRELRIKAKTAKPGLKELEKLIELYPSGPGDVKWFDRFKPKPSRRPPTKKSKK